MSNTSTDRTGLYLLVITILVCIFFLLHGTSEWAKETTRTLQRQEYLINRINDKINLVYFPNKVEYKNE